MKRKAEKLIEMYGISEDQPFLYLENLGTKGGENKIVTKKTHVNQKNKKQKNLCNTKRKINQEERTRFLVTFWLFLFMLTFINEKKRVRQEKTFFFSSFLRVRR